VGIQFVPPVGAGFQYRLRLKATPLVDGDAPAFPVGCQLRAEVRAFAAADDLAGALTTQDGTIVRIDDDTIELDFPRSVTGEIDNSTLTFDLVRTDPSPDEWMGIQVRLPVIQPITRPGADA
jgi:hypothetical protein